MGLIENKTAVITGGHSKISLEIATRFHHEGARIVLFGPEEESIKEACAAIDPKSDRVWGVTGDVRKKEDVKILMEMALEKTGRIDILVNNNELKREGKLDKTDPGLWMELMDTHAYAPWRLMVAVLPEMRKAGGGTIINISSIAGGTAFAGIGVYCASHAALQMLSRVTAKEVSSENIRVNLICPAVVEDAKPVELEPGDELISELAGKNGNPEDVADAALFLVSDQSSWLTGITLDLDGGRHLSPTP